MNKYRNEKIYCDKAKRLFDSKKEHERFHQLDLWLKAKEISNLELQPRFELQPSFEKNGKKYRKIEYIADFKYYDNKLKKIVVEDTKGFKTKDYLLKKKIFEYVFKDYELKEL